MSVHRTTKFIGRTKMFASKKVFRYSLSSLAVFASLLVANTSVLAATCPFDGGASDAVNDGLVLTRYALGITGAPMTASTRYASLDPLQVKNNIECVGCALDMNGDGQINTVDTTIIARHLAGFSGTALTNGLALGSAPSATRPDTASVVSFLANGCAVGGPINAWTQGGNSFDGPGVIGTNNLQPLRVKGGYSVALVTTFGSGLRVQTAATDSDVTVVNGSALNYTGENYRGTTVAGGVANGTEADYATVSGGLENVASGFYSTVVGGRQNRAGGDGSVAAGNRAKALQRGRR
jgi:hypothetical protein